MTTVAVQLHTDALIAALQAAGLTVGDGDAEGLALPYAVVYSLPGGSMSGNLDDPYEDADLVYQVTCVAAKRREAEWLADKVIATLVSGFSVTGRSIALVRPDGGPGTRPDYDSDPPVFISTPRFTIKSTAA